MKPQTKTDEEWLKELDNYFGLDSECIIRIKAKLEEKNKEILNLREELFDIKVKYQDAFKNAKLSIEHEMYYQKENEQLKKRIEELEKGAKVNE